VESEVPRRIRACQVATGLIRMLQRREGTLPIAAHDLVDTPHPERGEGPERRQFVPFGGSGHPVIGHPSTLERPARRNGVGVGGEQLLPGSTLVPPVSRS